MKAREKKVQIIGGGMAGLRCAQVLHQAKVPYEIYEASPNLGGRVQTDHYQGYRLDRGFQVFLEAYPEAHACLDYEPLRLCPFQPGATIWYEGQFHHISDPLRRWRELGTTLGAKVGTLRDKLKIFGLRRRLLHDSQIQSQWPEDSGKTTLEYLQELGFSDRFIEAFFRPFLGGIFLERDLQTPASFFRFVFKMFSQGYGSVPRLGMGQISKQMAASLDPGQILLNSPVQAIEEKNLILGSGEEIPRHDTVLATPVSEAVRLLGLDLKPAQRSVVCLYFCSQTAPLNSASLVLDGSGSGPVNHLAVMDQVSPAYAPTGQHLISLTLLEPQFADEATMIQSSLTQMEDWFGPHVKNWEHLKTYKILQALPQPDPRLNRKIQGAAKNLTRLYLCGDYLDSPSLQGALKTGRLAAEAIVRQVLSAAF